MKAMPIPTFNDLSSYFFKAKCLTLSSGLQKYEILGIANLLQRSPDLENLIIDLGPSTCVNVDNTKLLINFRLVIIPLLFISTFNLRSFRILPFEVTIQKKKVAKLKC